LRLDNRPNPFERAALLEIILTIHRLRERRLGDSGYQGQLAIEVEHVLRIQPSSNFDFAASDGTILRVECTNKGETVHEVQTEQPKSDELLATHI
jgi:hypothetical protein